MFPAGDARFRTRYVTLPSGVRLRTVECGPADADDVVLCLHGWACSLYSYRFVLPALAARGVRAIALDLPGHGLSQKPQAPDWYTLPTQAGAVTGAMDALGIRRATLVGHSMGAPIAAWLGVVSPERVARLVLLAPAGFGGRGKELLFQLGTPQWVAPVLPYLVPRWTVSVVFEYVYGRRYRPTQRDVDEYWAPTQFPEFTRAMWELLHQFPWTVGEGREFATVTGPTVVMDGALDHLVRRVWVRRYAESIPGARLVFVSGSGHVVPEEAPDLVADAATAED